MNNLAEIAVSKYKEEGLKSTTIAANRFLLSPLFDGLWRWYIDQYGISRTDLKHLADENGRILFADSEPRITYDTTKSGVPEQFLNSEEQYTPVTPFVIELNDCHLVGPGAIGFLHGEDPILETAGVGDDKELFISRAYKLLSPKDSRIISRKVNPLTGKIPQHPESHIFPLVDKLFTGYYHWILDYLPKLRLLELYESGIPHSPTILIRKNPPKYITETLALLGYWPNRCIEWDSSEIKVDNLVIATQRVHHEHSINDYRWLKNRLTSFNSSDVKNESKLKRDTKIYISRQNAESRKVTNYDELTKILNEYGFAPYILEDLSIKQQIVLFKNADIVMGPHGAGFTNTIFSENALIFELLPNNDKLLPYFYSLSNALGNTYEGLVVDTDGRDMYVDINQLQNRLELLC